MLRCASLLRPNRTTVGLKAHLRVVALRQEPRPNRTTVGLKALPVLSEPQDGVSSQSHHSGIESWVGEHRLVIGGMSPNRTTVGLKGSTGVRGRATGRLSQSHHSGIERR